MLVLGTVTRLGWGDKKGQEGLGLGIREEAVPVSPLMLSGRIAMLMVI